MINGTRNIPQINTNLIEKTEINCLIDKLVEYKNNLSDELRMTVKDICSILQEEREESGKYISEIIKKIAEKDQNLPLKVLMSIFDLFLKFLQNNNLLLIKILNKFYPIFISKIMKNENTVEENENIISRIGKILKKCGHLSSYDVETEIDNSIYANCEREKIPITKKIVLIRLLIGFFESTPTVTYNKIIETEDKFFALIGIYYKDSVYDMRIAIADLTRSFFRLLENRDNAKKDFYFQKIYGLIKENVIENYKNCNSFKLHGSILLIKAILPFSDKIVNNSQKILDKLFLLKNKDFLPVKNSIIEIIFDFHTNNEFIDNYLDKFCQFYIEEYRLDKEESTKNLIMNTLGKLSIYIPEEKFEQIAKEIISWLKVKFENKNKYAIVKHYEIRCLSQLMENYKELILKNIPLVNILEKMFQSGFSDTHVEFIQKLIYNYGPNTEERINIILISLNIISLILVKKFELKNSLHNINKLRHRLLGENNCTKSQKLDLYSLKSDFSNRTLCSDRKESTLIKNNNQILNIYLVNKNKIAYELINYLEVQEQNKSTFQKVMENMTNSAIKLLGNIDHPCFNKDILLFYKNFCESCLSENNLKIEIIKLAKSKWVPNYNEVKDIVIKESIGNIVNKFLNYVFFSSNEDVNLTILESLDSRYDPLLSEKYFLNILIRLFDCSKNYIKEKIIKILGRLIEYNSGYIIVFLKKEVMRIFLVLSSNQEIIEKEKEILLLKHLVNNAGKFIFCYLEEIFENLIQLLTVEQDISASDSDSENNDKERYEKDKEYNLVNLNMQILSILTELIKNNYHLNEKQEIYCHNIVKICIENLKENSNTRNQDILLKAITTIFEHSLSDWEIYDNQPDLVYILIRILKFSKNESTRIEALKIFGFIGAMDPDKLDDKWNNEQVQNENREAYIQELKIYSIFYEEEMKNYYYRKHQSKQNKRKKILNITQSSNNLRKNSNEYDSLIQEKETKKYLFYGIVEVMKILIDENKKEQVDNALTSLCEIILYLENQKNSSVLIDLILSKLIDDFNKYNDKFEILTIILYMIKRLEININDHKRQLIDLIGDCISHPFIDHIYDNDINEQDKFIGQTLNIFIALLNKYFISMEFCFKFPFLAHNINYWSEEALIDEKQNIVSSLVLLLNEKAKKNILLFFEEDNTIVKKIFTCFKSMKNKLFDYLEFIIIDIFNLIILYLKEIPNKKKSNIKNSPLMENTNPLIENTNLNLNIIKNNSVQFDDKKLKFENEKKLKGSPLLHKIKSIRATKNETKSKSILNIYQEEINTDTHNNIEQFLMLKNIIKFFNDIINLENIPDTACKHILLFLEFIEYIFGPEKTTSMAIVEILSTRKIPKYIINFLRDSFNNLGNFKNNNNYSLAEIQNFHYYYEKPNHLISLILNNKTNDDFFKLIADIHYIIFREEEESHNNPNEKIKQTMEEYLEKEAEREIEIEERREKDLERIESTKSQNILNLLQLNNESVVEEEIEGDPIEKILSEFNPENYSKEEDWNVWFKFSQLQLFSFSPAPILKACKSMSDLFNQLYNYAFMEVWEKMTRDQKILMISYLAKAIRSETLSPEIRLIILNLIEYMEREQCGIEFFDDKQLSIASNKCKAYAKELYYLEKSYRVQPEHQTFENLMDLYYDLCLPENAVGLFKSAQKKNKNIIEDDWFLKLRKWDEALKVKQRKRKEDPYNLELILASCACYEGLSDWENILAINEEVENNSDKIFGNNDNGIITESENKFYFYVAEASLYLKQWDKLEDCICKVKPYSDEEEFEKNIYQTIININKNNEAYLLKAEKCIETTRRNLDKKLPTLLAESYERAYKFLIFNEYLYQLEEIIQFKNLEIKSHNENNTCQLEKYKKILKRRWDRRLEIISEDTKTFERILSIRALVFNNIEEDYDKHLKLAEICREDDQFSKCMKILERLKKNAGSKIDIYVSLTLSISKCLKENDVATEDEEAINELKIVIQDYIESEKNNCQLSDKLKSKVYCYYAYLLMNKYEKNLDIEIVDNIQSYLQKSFKIDNKKYKAWHYYSLLNYKFFELLSQNPNKCTDFDKNRYAENALEGFAKSINIGGKKIAKILQDLLIFISVWFQMDNNIFIEEKINSYIMNGKNGTKAEIPLERWLLVIPQLLARLNIKNQHLRNSLVSLLTKLGEEYPYELVRQLIVIKNSSNNSVRSNTANQILKELKKKYASFIHQNEDLVNELNRLALLLYEKWTNAIEESAELLYESNDIEGMITKMYEMHEIMDEKPKSINEIHFHHLYKSELKNAKQCLKDYEYYNKNKDKNKDLSYIHKAWDIYYQVFLSLKENFFGENKSISMVNVSPVLANFPNSEVNVIGFHKSGMKNIIKISGFKKDLIILKSKQRPKKITMYGSDGKEYIYLLKANEDLRQDERAMQLFELVNNLLKLDPDTYDKKLFITRFPVLALSNNTGVIGWLSNCDTLSSLIKEYREFNKIPKNIENCFVFEKHKNYETSTMLAKLELFKEVKNSTMGLDLKKILWSKSKSSEDWLDRSTNYGRSLAVMSMAGYILGLGDRHPSNIMMEQKTGKILHIDFGDCFEVAQKRRKYPEKVPFRLTRMLVKALEISGIEGTFRITGENTMRVLRNNKDSLIAILNTFIHDPLVSFRSLIPLIMKERESNMSGKDLKNNCFNFITGMNSVKSINSVCPINFNKNYKNKFVAFNNNVQGVTNVEHSITNAMLLNNKRDNFLSKFNNLRKKNYINYKMDTTERQLLNEFNKKEEQDEAETKEINNIAKIVLERIIKKLNGEEFNDKDDIKHVEQLDVHNQVEVLINQATSEENICQSYIGWCPFW